jgi:hypothetical protein
MILSGRDGQVLWTPAPTTAVPTPVEAEIISLNAWKASFATDYEEVTSFGDKNKVYIPGLPDISGTFSGFWNSAELALFQATRATAPGTLKLVPNKNEPEFYWKGGAYLDASIDASLQAPKVTGNFRAADSWEGPENHDETASAFRSIVGGTPARFPSSVTLPRDLAALQAKGAPTNAAAWTAGQYVEIADHVKAHWNGSAWVAGAAPAPAVAA